MTNPKDVQNSLVVWLMRTVVGVLMAIIMAWAGFLHSQIADLRAEDKVIHTKIGKTKDQIMARVSRIEPLMAALGADVSTMKARLEGMDSKLDRALLHGNNNRRDR